MLVVAVATIALVGCGSDADPDAATPTSGATVTETVTAPAVSASAASSSPVPVTSAPPTAAPPASAPPASSAPAQPPTSYDEAVAHVAAGSDVGSLERFVTPSDNIYCSITEDDLPAACEVAEGTIEDPEACPDNPVSQFVGRLEFDTGGVATAVCNTDTIRRTGAPVLDYGSVVTSRDTQCISEEIGVTCQNAASGHGFVIARDRNDLY